MSLLYTLLLLIQSVTTATVGWCLLSETVCEHGILIGPACFALRAEITYGHRSSVSIEKPSPTIDGTRVE